MTTVPASFRYFLRTFGCQMNENDSEKIAGVLSSIGGRPAGSAEEADVILVNTCAVRAKSEDKLHSYLGRLRGLKRKKPVLVGVAGCVAQVRGEALLGGRLAADFLVGPDRYLDLPDILARAAAGRVAALERSTAWREAPSGLILHESPVSAYVTIMEGCNNFCSYCVVPFARGPEKYRPLGSIMAEVEDLARRGYREIQFLGQNVNSYRDPESGAVFADLLERSARVDGLVWIRFLTSHPRDFSEALIAAMAASPRICRQIHLPLQSGSTAVLRRMNRGYGREDYLSLVRRLRTALPHLSLSTDIIVGFPGETEADFADTLSALAEIACANIFSFRYSPRPGTAAAERADDVPLEVKRRRLVEVQALQKKIQTHFHRGLVGRKMTVLAGGPSPKNPGLHTGRNEGFQVVNFQGPADVRNRFVTVEIVGAGPYSLRGRMAESAPSA